MIINTITLENIDKTYIKNNRSISVLQNFSYTFCKGKSYAITGPSGAGKSTLLHILAGFDRANAGKIYINQQCEVKISTIQKRHIGFVFQLPYLIGECSALENIMLKGLIGGLSKHEAQEKAHVLLHSVDLACKADNYPHELSGGQQQRIAIARALMLDPDFIIADEPTGNLDEDMSEIIIGHLLEACKKRGAGLIISSHDQKIAAKMDEVIYIKPNLIHVV